MDDLQQTFSYLGSLGNLMRDLQGTETLAYELIQNADDAPDVTEISFRVTREALIVSNNGSFRDVDFERLLQIGRRGKRLEDGTTGAFGIGFVAVYQVTDRPTIRSAGQKWTIHPDQNGRISRDADDTPGTVLELPWAIDPQSPLRQELSLEAIEQDRIRLIEDGIAAALPAAALFLRKLKRLSLDGLIHRRVEVTRTFDRPDALRVTASGVDRVLPVWRGSFANEAAALRAKHVNLIEPKRSSDVSVALCGDAAEGRYYAYLPTNRPTGLPIHVQADFFPTQNRKDLPFDDGPASEWNRAAVDCAAVLLGSRVLALRDALGPEGFWRLLETAKGVETDDGRVFWLALHRAAQNAAVLPTIDGQWIKPRDGLLLKDAERLSNLLSALGLEAAHDDVAQFNNLLEGHFEVRRLDLRRLLDAVEQSFRSGVPAWLADDGLRGDLDLLLQQLSRSTAQDNRLETLPFVRRVNGTFGPAGSTFRAADGLSEVLNDLGLGDSLSGEPPDRFLPFLRDASAHLGELLRLVPDEIWHRRGTPVGALLAWLSGRTAELDNDLRQTVASLPIWPAGGRFLSLEGVVRPGDFEDPLGVANVLETALLRSCEPLLDALQVRSLTFAEFVQNQVPQAFSSDEAPQPDRCRALRRLLAERLGELRQIAGASKVLRQVPFVECDDGAFRCATDVYLPGGPAEELLERPSLAVVPDDDGASHELLVWLGVGAAPSLATLVDRIVEVVGSVGPPEGRQVVIEMLSYLCREYGAEPALPRELERLRPMEWLPAEGWGKWCAPGDLFTSFRKSLFESTGRFLDLPAAMQKVGSELLRLLGIETNPPIGKVVAHLRHQIERGREVGQDVYQELGQNASRWEVHTLAKDRCVWVGDQQRYFYPNQVFLRPVRFGRFGVLLQVADERARAFFKSVGVRDEPDAEDGVRILEELSTQFGNGCLDDEARSVWHEAWRLVAEGPEDEAAFERLRGRRVVLARDARLLCASELLFEDRAFVADRFGSRMRQFTIPVIPGPVGAAIERAGVRRLSSVVETAPAELVDSVESPDLTLATQALATQVARACAGFSCVREPFALVAGLSVRTAPAIRLIQQTECFGPLWTTEPFETPAWLSGRVLCVVVESREHPIAVARELSSVLVSNEESSKLACLISTVLERGDPASAARTLDQLGIPPAPARFEAPGESPTTFFEDLEVSRGTTQAFETDRVEKRAPASTPAAPAAARDADETAEVDAEQRPADEDAEVSQQGSSAADWALEAKPDRAPDWAASTGPVGPQSATSEGGRIGAEDTAPGARRARGVRPGTQRLRSYVSRGGQAAPDDRPPQPDDQLVEIDRRGTEAVLEYERRCGRKPTKMEHHQKGYDIYSVSQDGSDRRFIEVKSRSGRWDGQGVALSNAQYEFLRGKGADGWLYVVEGALGCDPIVHPIRNPVGQIGQYFFDDGWRGASAAAEPSGGAGDRDDWPNRWMPR